jgi:hypothetical protein
MINYLVFYSPYYCIMPLKELGAGISTTDFLKLLEATNEIIDLSLDSMRR